MNVKKISIVFPFIYVTFYCFFILKAFNIQNILDFMNITILYLPIFFIILSVLKNLETVDLGLLEIEYIQNRIKIKRFFICLANNMIVIILALIINLLLFEIMYPFKFNQGVKLIDYFIITFIAITFFSSFSIFISNLTLNKSISIFIVTIYWIYFMINVMSQSIFNPFYYVANPAIYDNNLIVQIFIIIIFILGSLYLKRKSPYFLHIFKKR